MRSSLGALAASALFALAPGSASAARGLDTGFNDNYYLSGDAGLRESVFDGTVEAQADIVRINVVWRTLVSGQPANPADPADPAYSLGVIDRAVSEASARGLDPLLTVYGAPPFAEAPNRSGTAVPGTWRPDPTAFAAFGEAVARRYSGAFSGLPRVRYFQAWNEPNLASYLTPQYENGAPVAPGHYRALLNAFHDTVKGVNPDNVVVTAGTAPYGDPPGGPRTRPLAFWRDVLCLEGRKQLRRTECPAQTKFDVLAHHPINTTGGPRTSAVHPDDVSTPDLRQVQKVLRAAEKRGTVGTGGRHPLWVTEIWWDSNPPDQVEGVPLPRHARFIAQALYVLWKQGASVVINLQIRDVPFDSQSPFADTSTGILFADGSPKPAFTAFRFPFVADRKSKRKLALWGKAPASGKLAVQVRDRKRWRTLRRVKVREDHVFRLRVPERGRATLRARVGGDRSLVWKLG